MNLSRIDEIRNMISDISKKQVEYYEFFPGYGGKIVSALGIYLGDEKSVALAPATGPFDFSMIYRGEGLGFQDGKYRIPIMVRFNNLADEGYMAHRFLLFCTKNGDDINISINNSPSKQVNLNDTETVCSHIFKHLKSEFSSCAWFDEHNPNYQSNKIGFDM